MTTHENGFTLTRTFEAPRALLWRAWTDPALTARWWHPDSIDILPDSVSIDLREGGTYAYTMTDGRREWPTGGTYLEIREPERLRFTWHNPHDPDESAPVATVELSGSGPNRTEMTFTLEKFEAPVEEQDDVHEGWRSAFDDVLSPLLVALQGAPR